eukprot:2943766-Pyramimonas_sp.AAC.2
MVNAAITSLHVCTHDEVQNEVPHDEFLPPSSSHECKASSSYTRLSPNPCSLAGGQQTKTRILDMFSASHFSAKIAFICLLICLIVRLFDRKRRPV